jgi:hypothetical protein
MRNLPILLLLLSSVVSAQAPILSRRTVTHTDVDASAAIPTTTAHGFSVAGVTSYTVLVRPTSGTLAGAGTLQAFYWTKIRTSLTCVNGCMFRAPWLDCTIDSSSSSAPGYACGMFNFLPGPVSGDDSFIIYRPVGVTLNSGSTVTLMYSLVTQ